MMDTPEQNTSPGMKPWLRILLVVSLALNLLVIGIIGGRILMWDRHHGHLPARIEQFGGPMSRALSHDDQIAVGRELRRISRGNGTAWAAQHAVFEALIAELRADRFDRAAVAAHMARQRAMFGERLTVAQGVLLDRLENMDAAARAAFADRLEDALDHRAHKRGQKP